MELVDKPDSGSGGHYARRGSSPLLGTIFICLFLSLPLSAPAEPISIICAGDVMLSRGVLARMRGSSPIYPFEKVIDLLRPADISFVNLECQLASSGRPTPGKEVLFRSPPEAVLGLVEAGIDVVSLANNHSLDYGPAALLETMDALAHCGIAFVGAGFSRRSAYRPAYIKVKDRIVAFLAYSWRFYLSVEADEGSPGVAVLSEEALRRGIPEARRWADYVVVSCHWGWEYVERPTEEDVKLAHLAIDLGADLVVGHHPHVIQPVERYKNGLICYSLGNFVFDQRRPGTREGLMLRAYLEGEGLAGAELIPVMIDPEEFRPYPATGAEARAILDRLKRLSKGFGTELIALEGIGIVGMGGSKLIGEAASPSARLSEAGR